MASIFLERRKKYVSMIVTYKTRRERLRRQYGIVDLYHSGKLPERYRIKAKRLTERISDFKEIIKRLDAVWDKIFVLEKAVVAFTGQKIKNEHRQNDKELRMAKYLYYKLGLESGIRGKELREYIGVPKTNWAQPLKFRARFTKSFSTTPENRALWVRFKAFYEQGKKDAQISQKHYRPTKGTKKGK